MRRSGPKFQTGDRFLPKKCAVKVGLDPLVPVTVEVNLGKTRYRTFVDVGDDNHGRHAGICSIYLGRRLNK